MKFPTEQRFLTVVAMKVASMAKAAPRFAKSRSISAVKAVAGRGRRAAAGLPFAAAFLGIAFLSALPAAPAAAQPTYLQSPDITSTPASGDTYMPGEEIVVRVRPVTSLGALFIRSMANPVLKLNVGGTVKTVTGEVTRNDLRDPPRLEFRYTVQKGDRDTDGVSVAANALTGGALNVGISRPRGGGVTNFDDVSKNHPAMSDQSGDKVDTPAPSFSGVTGPAVLFYVGASVNYRLPAVNNAAAVYNLTYSVTPALPSDFSLDPSTATITTAPAISPSALTRTAYTLRATDGFSRTADLAFTLEVKVGAGIEKIEIRSDPGADKTYGKTGDFGPNDNIKVRVSFTHDLISVKRSNACLTIRIGSNNPRVCNPDHTGRSRTLDFSYAVQASDWDRDGISFPTNPMGAGREHRSLQWRRGPVDTLSDYVTLDFASTPDDANHQVRGQQTTPSFDSSPAYSWVRGNAVSQVLPAATDGDGGVTYTIEGSLPAGLSFAAATRTISGTPTGVQGATNYTMVATDADGDSGRLTFSIEIEEITVSISSPSATEGAAGATATLEYDVTLHRVPGRQVTVAYAAAADPGTATSGTDYTAITGGTLTFAASETSQTFEVTVTGDALDEPDETVRIALSNPSGAILGSAATGVGTITDDDPTPTLALALSDPDPGNPDTINESGTGNATTVTASLSGGTSGEAITVTVSATPVYAALALDGGYSLSAARTLTIAAGATASTGTVTLTAVDDAIDSAAKTATVGGTVAGGHGLVTAPAPLTLTIADDDAQPSSALALMPASISESGGVTTVTATLSNPSANAVTVTVSAAPQGTEAVEGDFELSAPNTLTIAAGQTTSSGTVTVTAVGNTTDSADKSVTVSGEASGTPGAANPPDAILTIRDDDGPPTVSLVLSSSSVSEDGGVATVTAALNGTSSQAVMVTVSAAAVAASGAVAGDFDLSTATTLTIAANAMTSTGTVTITANDNAVDSPHKRVTVSGTATGGNGIAAPTSLTLTLADDEATPTTRLALSPASIAEAGGVSTVTATLFGVSSEATTITVSASPGAGTDFTLTGTTLTIEAGNTTSTATVTVTAEPDTTDSADKRVAVSGAASGGNGAESPPAATLTIVDDDALPTLSLSLSASTIDESGSGNVSTVTAALSHPSGEAVTVTVSASPGVGTDFTLTGTTLTIAAGSTASAGDVTITAVDDPADAPDKETTVSGAATGGRGVADPASLTLTIEDGDDAPGVTLAVSPASISENRNAATVTATLTHPSSAATTVTVTPVSGFYTAGSDVTIEIAAGETANAADTALVVAVNDDVHQGSAGRSTTVTGTAANAQAAANSETVTVTGVTLTLTDDETLPEVALVLAPASITESGGVSTVTATLSGASSEAVTVTVGAAAGTNAAAGDFSLSSDKTLTIAAGSTTSSGAVTVTANGNAADSPDKSVTVSGTASGGNGVAAPSSVTLTLTDDDAAPGVTLALSSSSISENGGSTTVSATLTHPSSAATTVTVTPVTGFYTVGSDATIVIAAGSTAAASDTAAIAAVNNTTDEPDRMVTVTVTVTNDQGTGSVTGPALTLEDDDSAPGVTLAVSPTSIAENGGVATVSATLTHPSSAATTVTVMAALGFYTVGSDATIEIAAGETANATDTALVTAGDDAAHSGGRSTTVTATAANDQGVGSVTGAALTLTDDEDLPEVALVLSSASISETGGVATVTATLSGRSSEAVTVTVDAAPGTGAVTGDFSLSSTDTLTIAAGDTTSSGAVTVTANGNAVDAPDKSVTVSGTASGGNGVAAPTSVTLTVTDDEAFPMVALVLSPAIIDESGPGNVSTVTATLSVASSEAVTVTVSTTPISGSDFTLSTANTLTIASGDTTSTGAVTVTAEHDTTDEPDETVTVSATVSGGNDVAAPTSVTLTLTDDETLPTVTLALSSSSISEGSGVTTVTAALSGASSEAVTVTVSAAPLSGATVADYALSTNKALVIAAGSTASTGTVTLTAVNNDVGMEADKTVTVSGAASGGNGVSAPAGLTLTITDNDGSVPTGSDTTWRNVGQTQTNWDVTTMSLVAETTSQTIEFTGGYQQGNVDVWACANKAVSQRAHTNIPGPSRTECMKLANDIGGARSVTIGITQAMIDNDGIVILFTREWTGSNVIYYNTEWVPIVAPPKATLSLSPSSIAENGGVATVTATLDKAASAATTITVSAAAVSPALPADFTLSTANTLTIATGGTASTGTVTVTAVDNAADAPDKTVTVSATASDDVKAPPDATLTITDDEGGLTVVESGGSTVTTEAGGTDTFTVRLTSNPSQTVNVLVTSQDTSECEVSADGGATYGVSGTVAMVPTGGDATAAAASLWNSPHTVTVRGKNDDVVDHDQTCRVTVDPSETGASTLPYNRVSTQTVSATTEDDDTAGLTVSAVTGQATEAGGTATFTVKLATRPTAAVTVTVTGGDASEGTVSPSSLTFAPGVWNTVQTVTVTGVNDDVDDGDQTWNVILNPDSGPAGDAHYRSDVAVPNATVRVSTTDDDTAGVTVTPTVLTVTEQAATGATFTVVLASEPPPGTTSVRLGRSDAEIDLNGVRTYPYTLSFTPTTWSTAQTVTVTASADSDIRNDTKEIRYTVAGYAGGVTNEVAVTVTVIDDDKPVVSLALSASSISENGGVATVTATLDKAASEATTVTVSAAAVSPAVSGDFNLSSATTLIIPAGSTTSTGTVTITPVDNATDAPDKAVTVSATAVGGNGATPPSDATLTITDDDAAPGVTLTLSPSSISENGGESTVTATLSHPSSAATTVTVTPVSGFYAVGSDTTIEIAAGETANATDTVLVTAMNDDVHQGAAGRSTTVTATAANAQATAEGETVAVTGAPLTLTDDERPPTVALVLAPASITESGGVSTVTATLSGTSSEAVTVTVTAAAGTGAEAADFTLSSATTLTIAAGDTTSSGAVTVTANGNDVHSPDKEVTVSAGAISGGHGVAAPSSVTLTLTDDEDTPEVALVLAPASISESGGVSTVTATLSGVSSEAVTVTVAATGLTAGATDFGLSNATTLTIAARATTSTGTVTVTAMHDVTDEADETVSVSGTVSGGNGVAAPSSVTLTITDDDPAPMLSIDSPSVTEGDSGSTDLTFTATLSAVSGREVTVQYADAGTGTATSGTDYTALTAGTLTFAAGTTSQTFDVSVTGDVLDEADETVNVRLKDPVNAAVSTTAGTGTGTITDNDATPTLLISSPSVAEGDSGSTSLTYTVTLSAASGREVTVQYADAGTGTATSGTDYTAITAGTLTFAAGTTSRTFNVLVTGDTVNESNETVGVNWSNAANATISTRAGLITNELRVDGTITDDDGAPDTITLTVDDADVGEGDGATTITVTATVDGTTRFAEATTVSVSVAGSGTAGAVDFAAVSDFNISIAAGAASATGTFTLTPTDDSDDETDETITVSGTSTGLTVNPVTISLTDNDGTPTSITLTVNNPSVGEVDGATTITVTATLDGSTTLGSATTVRVNVAGSGAATAVDFDTVSAFDITIAAGDASGTANFTLTPTDDVVDETDETITVRGTSTGLTVNSARISLTDDDAAPTSITLTVSDSNVGEGDGATSITVTATVDGTTRFAEAKTVRVSVAGSGTAGAVDFAAVEAFDIEIAAEAASDTAGFTLTPTDDAVDETDETVTVRGTSSGLTVNAATITLTDDDAAPTAITLTVDDSNVGEGDGAAPITVTATVDGTTRFAEDTTVTVSVAGSGTATAVDFAAVSSFNMTIPAGAASQTGSFTLTPTDDAVDETDETVTVSGTSGSLTVTAATITLTDDDAAPTAITLTVSDNSVSEGAGATTITVTATVDGTTRFAEATTVEVLVRGTSGMSTAVDFTAVSLFEIVIAAGAASGTSDFTLTPTNDVLDETDETVTVYGASPGLTVSSATIALTDDDATPTAITLSVDDNSVAEGDGATTITVTATVDGGTRFIALTTVTVSVAGSGAAGAVDFAAVSDFDIEINAGDASATGTFTLTPTNDAFDETNETITVSGTSGSLTVNSATIALTDDDDAPTAITLTVDDNSVAEDDGATTITVTATVDGTSRFVDATTVTVSVGGSGTATAVDFAAVSAFDITIAAGAASKTGTFTLTPTDDAVDETDETVTVRGMSSGLTVNAATITLTDDDDTPTVTLALSSMSITESSGVTTVTATLSGTSSEAVVVTVGAVGATAAAGDFSLSSDKTLTIAAASTTSTGTVTVTAIGDATDEPDETVTVSGTVSGGNGVAAPSDVMLTITDDDDKPTVTLALSPTSITESSGVSTVTATLSGTSSEAVVVTVGATAGTGAAANDFTLSSDKTLTIAAGATTSAGAVTVTANGNAVDAPDKAVTVSGTVSGGNGVGAPSAVTLTLTDDEMLPTVTLVLSPTSISESSGISTVTATLSGASSEAVVVTVGATAGTGAVIGDFDLSATTTLTIAAGATTSSGAVTVTANGNAVDSPDKAVTVSGTVLGGNGVAAPSAVTLTLTDDEMLPTVTLVLSPTSIMESSGISTVTATLSGASSEAVVVTVGAAAVAPAESGDFTLSNDKTLTIAAGGTTSSGAVTVTAHDNDVDAPDKSVTVSGTATGGNGVAMPSSQTLTLTDDEAAPGVTLSVASSSIPENGGTTTVSATLSHPSSATTTVTVTVAAGYTVGSDATIVITAGQTANATDTATILAVNNDVDAADNDVTVTGTAANDQGAGTVAGAMLTITDDDVAGIAVSPTTSASLRLRTTENGGLDTFTVKLASEPTGNVVLDVASSDTGEGAVSASSLTFTDSNWNTAQTVTLAGVDDAPADGDQAYTVTLTVNTTSTLDDTYDGVSAITVYAVNADNEYGLNVSEVTGQATEAGGTATFTVALLAPPSQAVTVSVSSLDASEGAASPSSLTFATTAWDTVQTVTVTGVDDDIDDGEVTWAVRLDPSSGDTDYNGLANVDVSVTTTDDDGAPGVTLALAPASMAENGGVSTVTATLSHPSGAATTVTVTVAAGYTVGSDAVIVIAAGETANASDVATIAAVNDNVHQGVNGRSTTVTATITNDRATADGTTMAVGGGALTLTDDEPLPEVTLALSSTSITESSGVSTVTATLSGVSSEAVTVTVGATGVTAAAGDDFALSSATTLTIAAGSTTSSGTVTVTAVGDTTDEPDETVTVSWTVSGGNGVVAPVSQTLTITDDDDTPTVTLALSSSSILESSGVSTVTATLSGVSSEAVTVTVGATGVTAAAGDFSLSSDQTLTIAAGSTTSSGTVTVSAVGDTTDEPDETVTVSGTVSGGNGVAAPSAVTLTVTDDEDTPTVTLALSPASISESGGVSTVTATLSGVSSEAVTVTVGATPGTGAIPADFTLSSATTLTIAAGATTSAGAVTVTANGNAVDAPDKTVTVSATVSGGNNVVAPSNVMLTLTDDEMLPTVALVLSPVSISESGGVSTVTATLSGVSSEAVTVTVDAAAGTGAIPADFALSSATTLTIAAGATTSAGAVTVTANGNAVDAPNKQVTVSATVSGGNNVVAPSNVMLTLTDDEMLPTVALVLSPMSISESGGVSTVTATLSGASSEAVTVTVDAAAGTGAIPADFALSSATTLTIAAGATTSAGAVTVTANGNAVDAPDKTVTVSATVSGGNNVVAPSNVTLTVTDDDPTRTATLVLSPRSIAEAGGVSTVTATLSGASSAAVTITVSAAAGTGAVPADFTLSSATTLIIAANATTSTGLVTVRANDNNVASGSKQVAVSGTATGGNGVMAPSSVTLTLIDDDTPRTTLHLSAASISENGGVATVTATLDRPSTVAVTITVSASPGSGTDFTLSAAKTLTFAATATTSAGVVTVTASNNDTDAPDKSVTVSGTASDSLGLTNHPSNVTLTITDDDAAPNATLSLNPALISENGGTSVVSATLSHRSSAATTVTVTAVTGFYTVGSDATIVIAAGSTTAASDTVTITAVDNPTDEPPRTATVTATLTNSQGAGSVTAVTLTLTDDDAAPGVTLALSTTTVTEAGGQATVSATLSHPSSAATTVTVTPVANAYSVASGSGATIVIAAGSTTSTDTATITAVDNDVDAADNPVTVSGTAQNGQGVGTVSGASLTITDDDDAGLVVSPATSASSRLRTTEGGGTDTFTVKLATKPTGDVVLGVASSNTAEGTVLPSSLTFTATTWNTEKTVTLTGVDDAPTNPADGNQDYEVTLTVNMGTDTNYNALSAVTVHAVNADNEYGLDVSSSMVQVTEGGGTATFTVALFTQPSAAVTVTVTSENTAEGTVSPSLLVFTMGTWNTAQPVVVTAVDDDVHGGNVPYNVVLAPSSGGDANYNGLDPVPVSVTTTDNDNPPTVMLAVTPATITENGGVATVTATLSGKSSQAVTLTVTTTAVSPAMADDFTKTGETLTIAAEQTTSTGLVTVTAKNNDMHSSEDKAVMISATATGGTVTDPAPVTLTITDDDTPKLVIDPTELALKEEETDPAYMRSYTVKLATEPTAAVTVTVTMTVVKGDTGVEVDPTTLTFTDGNWATAQPVTVKAGRDPETDYQNERVTLRHTVSSDDTSYASLSADVTVTVEDKDKLTPLQAGADTRINGHRVTVTATRAEATPAVTVTPSTETDGDIEVKISLYEGDPNIQMPDGGRFFLGSSAHPMDRTAVDITVTSEGRPLTDANRAKVLGAGLIICLPVSDALWVEAVELGRNLYFLHQNQNGEWTVKKVVEVVKDVADRAPVTSICATLLEFSPSVVVIDRGKKVTFEPDAQQSWTFFTGRAVGDGAGALPGATGDGRITYTLTPITLPLPAGLTYTPPGAGAEHGGTITGTPTTPTAPREYTLTATDVDKEKVSHLITIEVKPGIQSRDLGLVLAGVGRTLASDAVEILGGRFGSAPASRLQVTLGGQVLRLTNPQSPSPSSPPSPLAGEGQGEGGGLQGEGSLLQGEATRAVPVGSSPWQQATGLALGVARALGVTINTPSPPHSPSPLAGEGQGEGGVLRGEGGLLRGQGGFLQNEPNLPGRLPTDLRRGTTTSSLLRLQPVSGRDLLARSAFELPLTRTGENGVPAWTLWGRGSAAGFSGQPEEGFKMDGTLYSGYLGLDYRPQATVLLGLAVAHSTGDVNYEREATKAGADVELTSVLPYAHWQPRPGLGVWGLAGVGWGEMDLKLVGDPQTYTTELTSWLGAVGGRQALTTWQGIDLAAKTDAFLTTVRSAGKANLPAARGHAQRVRLVVEGRTAVDLSPVSRLEPRLELGGRWDNGTAEQGLGSELGGGVAYTRTDWGLSVDAQGRYLLLHEDGAFEDWGASMSVRLDPGVAGEGAYLTVAPVWGQASSGVEQLWGTASVLPQARGPSQPATGWQPGSLEVDVGYGLALADGRGLVTPYGGLALAGPGSARYRLGSRLALSSSLDVTLEGERAEQRGQKPAHGASVRLGWQW